VALFEIVTSCFFLHCGERPMVGVTEIALFERLQRALRKRGKYLRVADRKKRKRWGLGHYYIAGPNGVIDKDIDIEKLAREMKLLGPGEMVSKG
jgi:hypothetical protein